MTDISDLAGDDAFLADYDPATFDRPSLAVDLILATVAHGAPAVLLARRDRPPFAGAWALPGGFVAIDETLDAAARRVLADKARMTLTHLEQLHAFGAVDRDPRMRIVSIAYMALLPPDRFDAALRASRDLALGTVTLGEDGRAQVRIDDADPVRLAFDHDAMIGLALRRLRERLDPAGLAFAVLPDRFTLRALQETYEAILGRALNKPAFRRRMLDRGWLAPTGARETGASFRPAELYRHIAPPAED